MKKIQVLLVIITIIILSVLRFWNLGYSEFIPDETTVMSPIKNGSLFKDNFLSSQRKGPIQFLVAYSVNIFGVDPTNEFVYRFPFAVASCVALIFVFLSLYSLTNKYSVALVSTILLGVNGFIVAFGRIVQYQSFNLLFSFSALYFYSRALSPNKSDKYKLINVGIAIFLLFLSTASHWDSIFFLPIFVYLGIKLFVDSKKNRNLIVRLLIVHIALLSLLFVPLLVVYLKSNFSLDSNQSYFSGRIGVTNLSFELLSSKISQYVDKFRFYNPFFFLEVLGALFILGLFTVKKSWPSLIWLFFTLLVFIVFVKKPGTHIYNMIIPLSIISAHGFWLLTTLFKKWLVVFPTVALLVPLLFFAYQDYLLFIEPSVAYPWEQELIYKYKTPKYAYNVLANNVIGFPFRRNWSEINKTVNNDISSKNSTNDKYTFVTNEVTSISSYYLDIPFGYSKNMYAIGIKNPYSTVQDYSFPQYHNKTTIAKIQFNGTMSARVYTVTGN